MSSNFNQQEDSDELQSGSTPNETTGEPEPKSPLHNLSEAHEDKPGMAEEALKEQETQKKGFFVGLTISLVLNGFYVGVYWFIIGLANFEQTWSWQPVQQLGAIWLIANIGILILFAFVRRKVFQGLVAGLASAFFIMFVIGAFLTFVCYGALGG